MEIMTRFQLYLLIIIFGTFALLLQTGIPETWHWKSKENSFIKQFSNQGFGDKIGSKYYRDKEKSKFDYKKFILDSKSLEKSKKSNDKQSFLNDLDIQPPWSYEHFLANMSKLMKTRDHKEFNKLIRSAFNPLKTLPVIKQSDVTRVLVVTYFRSGSTFLGDLLQQNWKSFYTFEPLHYMTNGVRIDDEKIDEAFDLINKIFRCNFNNTDFYLNWVKTKKNQFLLKWNRFLWSVCRYRLSSCFDPLFVSQTCHRAKVNVMKLARLKMRQVETLMEDKIDDLNVKVVYLVRDPRGTMSSRKKLAWCVEEHNCTSIETLCSEMKEDLSIFKLLKSANPMKYIFVRYEDLAMNSYDQSKILFDRLNIPFSSTAKRYLKTHTNASEVDQSKRNPYTTKRNSKSIPFEWKTTLNVSEIAHVQNKCSDLITDLGYKLLDTNNVTSFAGDNQSVILENFNLD